MQYRQISRIEHPWQWFNLVFSNLTNYILHSLPGVFRSPFCHKALDSVGFHSDFNRPLITLWDQRDSSSSVICYRKWISGRLKSPPNHTVARSIYKIITPDTPGNEWIVNSSISQNLSGTHWQECSGLLSGTDHLALRVLVVILIVR